MALLPHPDLSQRLGWGGGGALFARCYSACLFTWPLAQTLIHSLPNLPPSPPTFLCQGLTRLPDGARAQQLLTNSVPGAAPGSFSPIAYADDLDILLGGDVVFSDASAIPPALGRAGRYDTMRSYVLTVLQGAPSGRLLRWHAGSGETSTLADGLWFPNGVALAADGSFVVVAETVTARILKHWLAGPKVLEEGGIWIAWGACNG